MGKKGLLTFTIIPNENVSIEKNTRCRFISISSVLFAVLSMTTTEFPIEKTGCLVMFQKLLGRAYKNMIVVCT